MPGSFCKLVVALRAGSDRVNVVNVVHGIGDARISVTHAVMLRW